MKWKYAVGDYVMVRDGDEEDNYKIMQRRIQYGQKYYRLDNGRIIHEDWI